MHSELEQMKKLFDVPTAGSWRQNTFWTMECTEIQVGHEVSESRSKSEAAKLTRKVFKKKKAAQTEEKKMQGTK